MLENVVQPFLVQLIKGRKKLTSSPESWLCSLPKHGFWYLRLLGKCRKFRKLWKCLKRYSPGASPFSESSGRTEVLQQRALSHLPARTKGNRCQPWKLLTGQRQLQPLVLREPQSSRLPSLKAATRRKGNTVYSTLASSWVLLSNHPEFTAWGSSWDFFLFSLVFSLAETRQSSKNLSILWNCPKNSLISQSTETISQRERDMRIR